ncbi:MAG: hypothetical protein F6J87_00840 [Spirulina sp. SIO3F2]|nr:hypothetical protein [Spirulina sp. SIO3F2]
MQHSRAFSDDANSHPSQVKTAQIIARSLRLNPKRIPQFYAELAHDLPNLPDEQVEPWQRIRDRYFDQLEKSIKTTKG